MGFHNKRNVAKHIKRRKRKTNFFTIGFVSGIEPDYYKTQGALANIGKVPLEKEERTKFIGGYVSGKLLPHLLTGLITGGSFALFNSLLNKKKNTNILTKLLRRR